MFSSWGGAIPVWLQTICKIVEEFVPVHPDRHTFRDHINANLGKRLAS